MPGDRRTGCMRKLIISNNLLFDEVCRLLEEDRQVSILAKGNSMLPFIRGNHDSVLLERVPAELHKGDIVLFKTEGRYILHRILRIDGENITLMGDGNLQGQEHCRHKDVVGKAVRILPPGEKAIDCNAPGERRKARIWLMLRPLRRYLLGCYRRIYKTY